MAYNWHYMINRIWWQVAPKAVSKTDHSPRAWQKQLRLEIGPVAHVRLTWHFFVPSALLQPLEAIW